MLTRRQGNPSRFRFIHRGVRVTFLLAALAAPQLGHAEPVPLHFDTFTPDTNITNMNHELGPGYTGGLTMNFLHVATCEGKTIDARVTAVVRPGTEFATGATNRTTRGYIPNYKATTPGQPTGDLGFLYAGVGESTPGITLTISFFDGTGDRRGTFREAYAVPDLRLLVYDVDGEPAQAEWFDASYADGLYSYATGTRAAKVTATPTATGVHFVGPGKDFRETDTSGAVLLRYCSTSRITLAFGAEQCKAGKNPVFSAIDGDLNLPVTGEFQTPKVVPAPRAVPPAPVAPPSKSVSRLYPADNGIRVERLTPAEVGLNVPFEYTLRVTNVTQTPVQDVVVRESLPRNFNLQSANPEPKKEGADLSWTLGSLDPKASREIKVSGVATTADNLEPCATVTFLVPPVCASIAVVEPKLTFTMTASQEILVCDPIEVQFIVTNSGTGIAQGVKIVEMLPAGLRTGDGKIGLVLNVGTLAPGQSRQLAGSLKAAKTGQYITKAVASAEGGLKAEATATTIVRQPVLAITKTGPARQYLGRPTTYEITVTNKGDAPAANTLVEDTIPPGVQGVQTSPAGAVSGSKVVWRLDTLAVNAAKKVSITYTPAGAGPLAQAATASAVCADAVTATAQTTVYGIAAVLLEVIDTDDPVQIGGQTTYLITATNQGSSPSTKVQITVAVEDAEEIVAVSGPTPVTVEGKTARSEPLATLAPKAKATWQVTVKALKAGDVRFRAAMTTAELGRNVEETEATQLYE
jgi:uncharacterized repeat protein (TIGR01451 family)